MKDIIISSLHFLVSNGRVRVYGFVIMPNHIHLIWQIQDGHEKAKVQQSFLKYTAQQMKFELLKTDVKELEKYKVKATDRAYQFWERNALSIDLWSRPVFLQKLNYMHNNLTQAHWNFCRYAEEYKYSSAKFYEKGIDEFDFLSHYLGWCFLTYHTRYLRLQLYPTLQLQVITPCNGTTATQAPAKKGHFLPCSQQLLLLLLFAKHLLPHGIHCPGKAMLILKYYNS